MAICLGFLVLTSSDLSSQVELGALGAFTLGLAWLIDFTVTPALCAGLRVVTLWDTLSLDLGRSPQESIPMFHGLSKAQARIVALMASVRDVKAGRMLIKSGEQGRELYVVIDGSLRVSIEGDDVHEHGAVKARHHQPRHLGRRRHGHGQTPRHRLGHGPARQR